MGKIMKFNKGLLFFGMFILILFAIDSSQAAVTINPPGSYFSCRWPWTCGILPANMCYEVYYDDATGQNVQGQCSSEGICQLTGTCTCNDVMNGYCTGDYYFVSTA